MSKKYYANVEKKYSFANGSEDLDKSKIINKKKISKSERFKKEVGESKETIEDKDKNKGFKSYRRDPFSKYKKK